MRSRRPAALWPLAVLVALLVGLPVLAWLRSDGGGEGATTGTTATVGPNEGRPAGEPLPIGVEPAEYEIVYRVEDLAGAEAAVSTEVVAVRRPFEGRVEFRSGPPPGDAATSTVVSGFAERAEASTGQPGLVRTVEPGPPDGDLRVAADLSEARRNGLLEFRERDDTVAGRDCSIHRTPVRSPSDRDEGDFRDLCIDTAGLLLRDEWTAGGTVIRRRTAVSVDVRPQFAADAFATEGQRIAVDDGGGGLTRLTDDSRNGKVAVYELSRDAAPDGFEHLGRYAISPTTPLVADSPIPSGVRVVGVIDVWVRGADYAAVFNGGADDGGAPFPSDSRARRVDLGAPGRGEVSVSLSGADVRADLGGGRFVRVFGTVGASDLLALARALEARVEGSITPVG